MTIYNHRITIKDVAKEAEVSTQTVSRVINERPDVAPDTRERILDIIDRLGYRPSELARSLIHQRSNTIGVVTAGLKYIGPNRTLNGITTQAEESGYALLLKELANFEVLDVWSIIEFLLARHVDGILWAVPEIGNNRDWLADAGIGGLPVPIVFLTMEARPGLKSISIDNYFGGQLATRHLIDLGRKHIGHLSGPLSWWEARERKRGWQDLLSETGLSVKNEHAVEGNWSSSSAETAINQLIDSYPEMDAVFVANDQMALTTLRAANKKGIRVPDDLAVIGFDDMAESAFFSPSLSTIHHDHHALGTRAVQELVEHIGSTNRSEVPSEFQPILLKPQLVARESTMPA